MPEQGGETAESVNLDANRCVPHLGYEDCDGFPRSILNGSFLIFMV